MNASNSDDLRFAQQGWVPRTRWEGRFVFSDGASGLNLATTQGKGDDVPGGFYSFYQSVLLLGISGNVKLESRTNPENQYWDFNVGYDGLFKHQRQRPAGLQSNVAFVRRGVEVWANCDHVNLGETRKHDILTETETGTTYLPALSSSPVSRLFSLVIFSRPFGHTFPLGISGTFAIHFRAAQPFWSFTNPAVVPSGNLTVTYRIAGKPVKEVILSEFDQFA